MIPARIEIKCQAFEKLVNLLSLEPRMMTLKRTTIRLKRKISLLQIKNEKVYARVQQRISLH